MDLVPTSFCVCGKRGGERECLPWGGTGRLGGEAGGRGRQDKCKLSSSAPTRSLISISCSNAFCRVHVVVSVQVCIRLSLSLHPRTMVMKIWQNVNGQTDQVLQRCLLIFIIFRSVRLGLSSPLVRWTYYGRTGHRFDGKNLHLCYGFLPLLRLLFTQRHPLIAMWGDGDGCWLSQAER